MRWSHKNITRLKNVTNSETGKAYLNLVQKEFVLHYPTRRKNGILETREDELIVLFQRAHKSSPRYLTHVVRPIDNILIDSGKRDNFRFGRRVELIAYTGIQNKIPFQSALLSALDFRNRAWGNAEKLSTLVDADNLEKYQIDLWNLFQPYLLPDLFNGLPITSYFENDTLDLDFESAEGKQKFIIHRKRERDSEIVDLKKSIAFKSDNYQCFVCEFSFIEFYGEKYIECHHNMPIHEGERVTKLEDLILVCSNCHRMLHRKIYGKYLSPCELRSIIIKKK